MNNFKENYSTIIHQISHVWIDECASCARMKNVVMNRLWCPKPHLYKIIIMQNMTTITSCTSCVKWCRFRNDGMSASVSMSMSGIGTVGRHSIRISINSNENQLIHNIVHANIGCEVTNPLEVRYSIITRDLWALFSSVELMSKRYQPYYSLW